MSASPLASFESQFLELQRNPALTPPAFAAAYRKLWQAAFAEATEASPAVDQTGDNPSPDPALESLPARHRGLAIAQCAWGLISADGLEAWLTSASRAWDTAAVEGFTLLGCAGCEQALVEARELFGHSRLAELTVEFSAEPAHSTANDPEAEMDRLWQQFVASGADFDTRLSAELAALGPPLAADNSPTEG